MQNSTATSLAECLIDHANLRLAHAQDGDAAGQYLVGLLMALSGLARRGELSPDICNILGSPFNHKGIVLAGLEGSTSDDAELAAFLMEML